MAKLTPTEKKSIGHATIEKEEKLFWGGISNSRRRGICSMLPNQTTEEEITWGKEGSHRGTLRLPAKIGLVIVLLKAA